MTAVATKSHEYLPGRIRNDERDWYESDLQLAAELGKTLLERNRELECNLRQYATYVEEQNREIEFLTGQLSATKDVNESRLKLYEQLETSIAEFDKINIKLQQESTVDKKKIKSLDNTVNLLEKRCQDLETLVEELKSTREYGETPREIAERNHCHVPVKTKDVFRNKENEYEEEICKLKASLSKAKSGAARERRQREELELELSFLLQENTTLQKQLECYKEKLLYLDGKCNRRDRCQCVRNDGWLGYGRSSVNDLTYTQSDVEDDSLTKEDLTLFHLNNGVVAYGKRDSIAPVSDLIDDRQYETRNATSLLNELDAQYRVLIDKYEYMVRSRSKKDDSENINYEDSSAKDPFGSNSDQTKDPSDRDSGISEISDRSLSSRASVRTDISNKFVEGNFKHGPPAYKKLFAEIFSVLKRSLSDDGEEKGAEESKDAVAEESVVPNCTSEPTQTDSKEDFSATEKKKLERSDKVNTANDAPVSSGIRPSSVASRRKSAGKKSCDEIVKSVKNSAFAEIRAKFENGDSDIPVKKNRYKTYADVLKGRRRVAPRIQ
ncbi:cerebellar degeneration-related protein 2-like [Centruroides vittatus]|uniref:cerebellar degeneration-related protein 2-like n=1 Tax=Centruroides vittatus TaxID=120091 RepID=UPI00350F2E0A